MISHKLKEVEAIADSITVIRDGRVVSRMEKSEINEQAIIRQMVGREIADIYPKRSKFKGNELVLETIHLNYLIKRSFEFNYKGEVVGVVGLMGAGRTELA